VKVSGSVKKSIAGNIGSGKSTLLEFLASNFDIQPFYEPNASNVDQGFKRAGLQHKHGYDQCFV